MAQQNNADDLEKESRIDGMDRETFEDDDKPGTPSAYACPDCGGVLWELEEDDRFRYRCRVGHAYSANGLLRTHGDSLEAALWSAFRVLQEHAALARRLHQRARRNGQEAIAEKFDKKAQTAAEHAEAIRQLLLSGQLKNEPETSLE